METVKLLPVSVSFIGALSIPDVSGGVGEDFVIDVRVLHVKKKILNKNKIKKSISTL